MVQTRHVAFYLGWPGGGVETLVANLSAALPDQGWTPFILVNMAVCPNWKDYYEQRGVAVRALPFQCFEDPKGKDYILEALFEIKADLYIPNYQEIPHAVLPEFAVAGKAAILIANACFADYLAEIVPFARYTQAIVGVSRTICRLLRQMPEVPAERVHYLPPGVHVANVFQRRSAPPADPLRIIYTGRLTEEHKRVWRYLELARFLEARNVPYEMTLLGDGPDRPAMAEHVRQSPLLRRRVRLPGAVLPEEVPAYLRQHDVFVLLSDTEGISLALLEAMGHGLVPVASHIQSGVAEVVVPGHNGFLVPIGDVEAAAGAIAQLSRSPALRARLAQRAYMAVRDTFAISVLSRQYAALFDGAASIARAEATMNDSAAGPEVL